MYQTWYQMTALLKSGKLNLHPVITDRIAMKDFSQCDGAAEDWGSQQDSGVSERRAMIGVRALSDCHSGRSEEPVHDGGGKDCMILPARARSG